MLKSIRKNLAGVCVAVLCFAPLGGELLARDKSERGKETSELLVAPNSRTARSSSVERKALATSGTRVVNLEMVPASQSKSVERIIGGVTTNGYSNVGFITASDVNGKGWSGTGTLVAPNWVLTAAHVADARIIGLGQTRSITVKFGGASYPADLYAVHESFGQFVNTNAGVMLYGDIALVRLSRSVPATIPPARIQTSPGTVGQNLVIVGFGDTGTGAVGSVKGSGGVKRVGTVKVDGVASHWLMWRFDQNERYSTAKGDSGGPQFNSSGAIASITSAGSGKGLGGDGTGWGSITSNMRCDVYFPWMRQVVSAYSN